MISLVLLGGGGHARVIIDAIRSRPERFRVIGFVDPQPCEETTRICGIPWLGDDLDRIDPEYGDYSCVLGFGAVGSAHRRHELVERARARGAKWSTVVHTRSYVSPDAILGEGSVVFAGAVINAGAKIGEHCIVNTNAVVEHDVELGSFVHVAPAVAIGGGARIGAYSHLGLGCKVRDHVTIGPNVTVGMGAVVVSSVPEGLTVAGVPARRLVGHDR